MLYESELGNLRIVATGDAMLTRRLQPFAEPDFLGLVDLIKSADVSFTNMESTVRNPEEGIPSASVGTVMTTPPELLADLKWMGFNLVATANNHAADYGTEGILATTGHLRRAGLVYAGSGSTLGKARAPGYLDTQRGRVALVAATSSYPSHARASDPRPDATGRPGVSAVAFSKVYQVADDDFKALQKVKETLGLSRAQKRLRAHFFTDSEAPADEGDDLAFLGQTFRRSNVCGSITSIDNGDAEAVLKQIREARRRADWVVFSFHNGEIGEAGSETARTRADMEEPAAFAVEFARSAIDAGADAVFGHGPHIPMGVEIYKERPIFHSLGDFILQNDTVESYPSDAYGRFGLGPDATPADFLDTRSKNDTKGFAATEGYWRSVVAACEFRNHKLSAVKLYPVDIGYGKSRAQRGRPLLARKNIADETLQRIKYLSQRYGTVMTIEKDVATIELA